MVKRISVVEYDPKWAEQFAELRDWIWPVVHDVATSIEHVGSTSVLGLAAKPIIDLDIVADSTTNVATCISRIAELGYTHKGDLGISGREAFGRPPHSIAHHLYVCLQAGQGYRNHIAIRDYLRSSAEAIATYAELKRNLAEAHPHDIDAYIEGKSAFLTGLLEQSGFSAEELAEIRDANTFNR